MNDTREAETLLRAIPGWSRCRATLTRLPGGLNNRTYRVDAARGSWVLRVATRVDPTGQRDFELELKIQQLAAGKGLAPRIEFSDPASGLMLCEYLPGRVLAPRDLEDRAVLRELATLLRRLHQLPRCGKAIDAVKAVRRYRAALDDGPSIAFADRCVAIVEVTPPAERLCCCHNDVVAENLVAGDTLKLIDFEYARDNDPLFDLACVIGWHNLDDTIARYLLDSYAGGLSSAQLERLEIERRRFDAIQWLWLAARRLTTPSTSESRQMARIEERLA